MKRQTKNFRKQLVYSNVLLVLLPTLAFNLLVFAISRGVTLREGEKYSQRLIAQAMIHMDSYMEDMINISILPMYDEGVQSVLQNSSLFYIDKKYTEMYSLDKLENFIFMIDNMRSEIAGVFIYCEDGRVFHNARNQGIIGQYSYNTQFDYRQSEAYRRAKEAGGKSVIIPTHRQEQVLPDTSPVFSVAKMIRNLSSGKELAFILIDVNLTKIEEMCQSVLYHPDDIVIVTDEEGGVVYSSRPEDPLFIETLEKAEAEGGSWYETIRQSQYLITSETQAYSGWKMTCFIPVNSLLAEVNRAFGLVTVLLLLLGLSVIFLIQRIAQRMTAPIYRMVERMGEVEKGNLQVRVEAEEPNELGMLADSFNTMLENLDELLHQSYILELECKEAQLFALQSQINPHFLYNTLDSIHMLAELNGDYDVAEMITSLAKMMRYTISSLESVVTVSEEMAYLNRYMAFQKLRYADKISFSAEIEEALHTFEIPRLLFQPLVENCIQHGMCAQVETISIWITGRVQDGAAVFEVRDNGVGMTPETLENVRTWIQDKTVSSKEVGIKNVLWRIRYQYGKNARLTVDSQYGRGVRVICTLPMPQ